MNLCRCPHCDATFQVNIPYDSHFWEDAVTGEDGFAFWVCMACRKRGLPDVTADEARRATSDARLARAIRAPEPNQDDPPGHPATLGGSIGN